MIPKLAADLHNELPELKGFSERNLKRMLGFYRAYPPSKLFVPEAVAQTHDLSKVINGIESRPKAAFVRLNPTRRINLCIKLLTLFQSQVLFNYWNPSSLKKMSRLWCCGCQKKSTAPETTTPSKDWRKFAGPLIK